METAKKRTISDLFDTAARFPYLIIAAVCLLLIPFGFGEKSQLNAFSLIYAGIVFAILWALFVFKTDFWKTDNEKLIAFAGLTAASSLALYIIGQTEFSPVMLLWIPLGFLILFTFDLKRNELLTTRNFVIMLIIAGMILRIAYIMYTSSAIRQHDMGSWTQSYGGHAHYIRYWYENGIKLPEFDVRTYLQFYHPPLHHWLMALLLRILTILGVDYTTACEAIQILPMMYSSLTMVVCYRIFRRVKLSDTPLIVVMAFICFHPTFVFIGSFYNNDMLCIMLTLMAVHRALVWYEKPTFKNIIPIALCLGLAMMTKLSGWMVAPAIALLFIVVFFKNIKKFLSYIGQFITFAAICMPLALWWPVRNLIKFNMPLTYVQNLGTSLAQYVGDMSTSQRLFDFGNGQMTYVFNAFTSLGSPYDEYNPTLGLLKSSVFDEGDKSQLGLIAPVFFWVALVLFTIMFVCLIISFFSKKTGLDVPKRIFFFLIAAVHMVSYYTFCFNFPLSCTQNIRYCTPMIPLCAIGLGLIMQKSENKIFKRISTVLVTAFCALSLLMFTALA